MVKLFFSKTYISGNGKGSGSKTWREQYLTHTERKFIGDIEGMVKPGGIVKMKGALNPCRGGCQPAIRDILVGKKGAKVSYEATSTGKTYEWEGLPDGRVKQTEKVNNKIKAFLYNLLTRRRKSVNCTH